MAGSAKGKGAGCFGEVKGMGKSLGSFGKEGKPEEETRWGKNQDLVGKGGKPDEYEQAQARYVERKGGGKNVIQYGKNAEGKGYQQEGTLPGFRLGCQIETHEFASNVALDEESLFKTYFMPTDEMRNDIQSDNRRCLRLPAGMNAGETVGWGSLNSQEQDSDSDDIDYLPDPNSACSCIKNGSYSVECEETCKDHKAIYNYYSTL